MGKKEKLVEKVINCVKIPIIQKEIKSLFLRRFLKTLEENFASIDNFFSFESIKNIKAIIPDKRLNKKQTFIPYISEIYPPKKSPANTEVVFEAKI